MSGLTTHVLDTAGGLPVEGLAVGLERRDVDIWTSLTEQVTDTDGRARLLDRVEASTYRLTFATGAYLGPDAFYPRVRVEFAVTDPDRHHHVPLLLSPYGYSTYRGS
ncbi:MAG: hydroxyisourate hydrolase [Actinomycetes bacterium]